MAANGNEAVTLEQLKMWADENGSGFRVLESDEDVLSSSDPTGGYAKCDFDISQITYDAKPLTENPKVGEFILNNKLYMYQIVSVDKGLNECSAFEVFRLNESLDLESEVKSALTSLTSEPSMLINLASSSAADVLEESPKPGVTGVLPISHGGTGVTSLSTLAANMEGYFDTGLTVNDFSAGTGIYLGKGAHGVTISLNATTLDDCNSYVRSALTSLTDEPSMLVNLNSAVSADVFEESPRPGVTGTLPVVKGGTGVTSLSSLANNLKSYLGSSFKMYTGTKVISSGGNWPAIFTSSQYRSLTGHTFNQNNDVVLVMNGDSDADMSAMYAATYRGSTGNIGVQKASTQTPVRVQYLVVTPA